MNPDAIEIAKSRLRVARRALEDLKSSEDKPADYADHWFVFLTAWKGVYTTLEQGSKTSPQSRQWFGGKKAARKADELLQYLFEARNDESHGLMVSVRHTQGGTLFKTTTDISGLRVRFDRATGRPLGAVDENGNEVAELIQHTPPGPELRPVTARGPITYQPPTEHLGQRIDIRPTPVAELALRYAEGLVAEAESSCTPSR